MPRLCTARVVEHLCVCVATGAFARVGGWWSICAFALQQGAFASVGGWWSICAFALLRVPLQGVGGWWSICAFAWWSICTIGKGKRTSFEVEDVGADKERGKIIVGIWLQHLCAELRRKYKTLSLTLECLTLRSHRSELRTEQLLQHPTLATSLTRQYLQIAMN